MDEGKENSARARKLMSNRERGERIMVNGERVNGERVNDFLFAIHSIHHYH